MNQIETIIEAYRESDSEQRLSLFLQHRDLRDLFVGIDRSDLLERVEVREPVANCGPFCRLNRIFD
jgi:hypothetical protein